MGNEQSAPSCSSTREYVDTELKAHVDAAASVIEAAKKAAKQKCLEELAAKRKATVESASEEDDERSLAGKRPVKKKRKSRSHDPPQSIILSDSETSDAPSRPAKKQTSTDKPASGKWRKHASGSANPKRKSRPKAPPLALYKATVTERAEIGTIKVTGSTSDVDNSIIERIKKCLDRGKHHAASEMEAKAALSMADKLMTQFKITTAEVIAHESASNQQQYAGHSVVRVTRVDEDDTKPVKFYAYMDSLMQAMNVFFSCKTTYNNTNKHYVKFTFNGIAENTVAAALAFEMVYNLIGEWARWRKGAGSKNSYCLGIAEELCQMAEEARRLEEEQAKKVDSDTLTARVEVEKHERQAQLDRLAPVLDSAQDVIVLSDGPPSADAASMDHPAFQGNFTNPITLDSDSEGDFQQGSEYGSESDESEGFEDDELDANNNGTGSSNFNLPPNEPGGTQHPSLEGPGLSAAAHESNSQAPTHGSHPTDHSVVQADCEDSPQAEQAKEWASHMQVITYQNSAAKIAEDHIKETLGKLKKGRKRSTMVRDWHAYDKGVADGKKIDVHRKTVKASGADEGMGDVTLVKHKVEKGPWFKVPAKDV